MEEKKKKAGSFKKVALIVLALALAAGAGAVWWYTGGVDAVLSEAQTMDVAKLVTETGTVESKNAIQVTAKNGGEISKVYIAEGDAVSEGELLVKSDASAASLDVAGIQAQAAGVKAQYETAQELADKNKALYEEGVISYDTYLQSKTAADQLEAQLEALAYNAASVTESTGGGKIKAPMSGIITAVYVKEGEQLQPGGAVVEISGKNDSFVAVNLISSDADLVRVGMTAVITDSGDEDQVICQNASVRKIAIKAQDMVSELGITQKRVPVEIALPKGVSLRLGSEVDVRIAVEKKEKVLAVPEKAIFQMDGKDCVYTVESGRAVLRQVETGLAGEDDTEILSGLKAGEPVIVSPGDDVADGVRIKSEADRD